MQALLDIARTGGLPLLGGIGLLLGVTVGGTWWLATRPLRRTLRALEACLGDFREGDFGRRIAVPRGNGKMGQLVSLYNSVGDTLRTERRRLVEREMLLESILGQNPTAIVLSRDDGRILVANRAAERLLNGGFRLTGKRLEDVAERWPSSVKEAFGGDAEAVFSVPGNDDEAKTEEESFHLTVRRFALNGREHTLHAVRRLTPELRRQEVAVWKRVIRTISHEINNTLAPISSLAHSAKLLRKQPGGTEQLDDVLDTIGDSAARLRDFIASYARFARLPEPNKRSVDWTRFLREVSEVAPFGRSTVSPSLRDDVDEAQMQQVLINLVKNAREAGSQVEDIEVRVERPPGHRTLVRVMDRGRGMTDSERARALAPFYSTKREGSGLGLALCREIVEAHGGQLDLTPREGGGTVVSLWLPHRKPG